MRAVSLSRNLRAVARPIISSSAPFSSEADSQQDSVSVELPDQEADSILEEAPQVTAPSRQARQTKERKGRQELPAIFTGDVFNPDILKEDEDISLDIPSRFKDVDFKKLNAYLKFADDTYFRSQSGFAPPPNDRLGEFPYEPFQEAQTAQETMNEVMSLDHYRELAKMMTILHNKTIIAEGRHVKVEAWGKIESYSCFVVAGNEKGCAGYGFGKGKTSDEAFVRACLDVRKHLLFVPTYESRTIFDNVVGKCKKTKVVMKNLPRNYGLTAGRVVYHVMRAFGFKDLSAKVIGSRNPVNVVLAVFEGLARQVSLREKAIAQGKHLYRMFDPALVVPDQITKEDLARQSEEVLGLLNKVERDIAPLYEAQVVPNPIENPMVQAEMNAEKAGALELMKQTARQTALDMDKYAIRSDPATENADLVIPERLRVRDGFIVPNIDRLGEPMEYHGMVDPTNEALERIIALDESDIHFDDMLYEHKRTHSTLFDLQPEHVKMNAKYPLTYPDDDHEEQDIAFFDGDEIPEDIANNPEAIELFNRRFREKYGGNAIDEFNEDEDENDEDDLELLKDEVGEEEGDEEGEEQDLEEGEEGEKEESDMSDEIDDSEEEMTEVKEEDFLDGENNPYADVYNALFEDYDQTIMSNPQMRSQFSRLHRRLLREGRVSDIGVEQVSDEDLKDYLEAIFDSETCPAPIKNRIGQLLAYDAQNQAVQTETSTGVPNTLKISSYDSDKATIERLKVLERINSARNTIEQSASNKYRVFESEATNKYGLTADEFRDVLKRYASTHKDDVHMKETERLNREHISNLPYFIVHALRQLLLARGIDPTHGELTSNPLYRPTHESYESAKLFPEITSAPLASALDEDPVTFLHSLNILLAGERWLEHLRGMLPIPAQNAIFASEAIFRLHTRNMTNLVRKMSNKSSLAPSADQLEHIRQKFVHLQVEVARQNQARRACMATGLQLSGDKEEVDRYQEGLGRELKRLREEATPLSELDADRDELDEDPEDTDEEVARATEQRENLYKKEAEQIRYEKERGKRLTELAKKSAHAEIQMERLLKQSSDCHAELESLRKRKAQGATFLATLPVLSDVTRSRLVQFLAEFIQSTHQNSEHVQHANALLAAVKSGSFANLAPTLQKFASYIYEHHFDANYNSIKQCKDVLRVGLFDEQYIPLIDSLENVRDLTRKTLNALSETLAGDNVSETLVAHSMFLLDSIIQVGADMKNLSHTLHSARAALYARGFLQFYYISDHKPDPKTPLGSIKRDFYGRPSLPDLVTKVTHDYNAFVSAQETANPQEKFDKLASIHFKNPEDVVELRLELVRRTHQLLETFVRQLEAHSPDRLRQRQWLDVQVLEAQYHSKFTVGLEEALDRERKEDAENEAILRNAALSLKTDEQLAADPLLAKAHSNLISHIPGSPHPVSASLIPDAKRALNDPSLPTPTESRLALARLTAQDPTSTTEARLQAQELVSQLFPGYQPPAYNNEVLTPANKSSTSSAVAPSSTAGIQWTWTTQVVAACQPDADPALRAHVARFIASPAVQMLLNKKHLDLVKRIEACAPLLALVREQQQKLKAQFQKEREQILAQFQKRDELLAAAIAQLKEETIKQEQEKEQVQKQLYAEQLSADMEKEVERLTKKLEERMKQPELLNQLVESFMAENALQRMERQMPDLSRQIVFIPPQHVWQMDYYSQQQTLGKEIEHQYRVAHLEDLKARGIVVDAQIYGPLLRRQQELDQQSSETQKQLAKHVEEARKLVSSKSSPASLDFDQLGQESHDLHQALLSKLVAENDEARKKKIQEADRLLLELGSKLRVLRLEQKLIAQKATHMINEAEFKLASLPSEVAHPTNRTLLDAPWVQSEEGRVFYKTTVAGGTEVREATSEELSNMEIQELEQGLQAFGANRRQFAELVRKFVPLAHAAIRDPTSKYRVYIQLSETAWQRFKREQPGLSAIGQEMAARLHHYLRVASVRHVEKEYGHLAQELSHLNTKEHHRKLAEMAPFKVAGNSYVRGHRSFFHKRLDGGFLNAAAVMPQPIPANRF